MRKPDPVLPFDAAAKGQTSPVRSARPLVIIVQLVLVFIIARRGLSCHYGGPGSGKGLSFQCLRRSSM